MMKKGGKKTYPVNYRANEARERNEIGKKIKELRQAEKISLRDFSELLKERGITVTPASINKWELGQTLPNAYQLLAVFDCFRIGDPGACFSGNALLNEEGLRKVAEYKTDLSASGRYVPERESTENILYVQMPVSLLSASAGTGDYLDDDCFEYRSFPKDTVPEGADFAVRVDGDSMMPKYEDGQIVWVRRAETLRSGEEGLFVLNGCGFIKLYREQADISSQGSLQNQPVLCSYNSAYAPIRVGTEDSFRVCGKIVAL